MPDREKVIEGLECCSAMNGDDCRECPYSSECVTGEATYQTGTAHLAADALALLKEQEPDETRLVRHYSRPGVYADLWLHCEKCGGKVDDVFFRPKFCPECGRAVKWDAVD